MKTFSSLLGSTRKKSGVSQRELARRVKIAPSYLNEIEKGERGIPSVKIVKKLASELGVRVEDFYDMAARENLQLPPDMSNLIRSRPESLELLRTIDRYHLRRDQIISLKKQIEKGFLKAIILAAGKGARMKHMTESLPKCLAIQFGGRTLLQTQLETLRKCGIYDIVVVRGYQGDKINYPNIRYTWNHDYENNNILGSLMSAVQELEGDVLVSYSDIWYEESVVRKLMRSDKDIAIGVDIDWKDYYEGRKEHPIEEAENVIFDSDNRVIKIGKIGASVVEVHGEFIGMMKLTSRGAALIKENYRRAKALYEGKPFQRAKEFRNAYLTDLLQDMADLGIPIHCEIIGSKWKEIDTIEDFKNVVQWLSSKAKPKKIKKESKHAHSNENGSL